MKFYIACHCSELAKSTSVKLLAHGHTVVSRWHDKPFHPTEHHSVGERFNIAIEDLNDIKRSDALILVSGPDKSSGGKFVEAGIAYGLGLPVYYTGHRENMLCYLFEETRL
jgi:nucleoside 2-deoxyribosyltransferase